jgi:hypothetical protein
LLLLSQTETYQTDSFKLKKKETQYGHNQGGNNSKGNLTEMWYFCLAQKMRESRKISEFVTVGVVDIIAFLIRAC